MKHIIFFLLSLSFLTSAVLAAEKTTFVNEEQFELFLKENPLVKTQYLPLDLDPPGHLPLEAFPQFLAKTIHFNKSQNKYFEVYRLAQFVNSPVIKGAELDIPEIILKKKEDYVKNFKPFYREIKYKQTFNNLKFVSKDIVAVTSGIGCKNNICSEIKLEISGKNFTFKPKGKLKEFKSDSKKAVFLFEVNNKGSWEEELWEYALGEKKWKKLEVVLINLKTKTETQFFSNSPYDMQIISNEVFRFDYDEHTIIRCLKKADKLVIDFKCYDMQPDEIKLQKLSAEKGDFIGNAFQAFLDPNRNKKIATNEILINFTSLFAEDRYKTGDDIYFIDPNTGAKEKGKLLRIDNSILSSNEYFSPAGIASVNQKKDSARLLAFFKFNDSNVQFCKIQRDIKADENLKKAIEIYRNPKAKPELRRFQTIELTEMDNLNIINVSYSFDVRHSEDNVTHESETLLFEKTNNSYKFLNRLQVTQSVLLCLKQTNKGQWQFLIENSSEYQGSTSWAEFKENKFQKYYDIEAWMD